jgi:hypothetical protein
VSFIDHRCGACGHLGYNHHRGAGACEGAYPCHCTAPGRDGPSVLVPVVAFGGVDPLPVRDPGTVWHPVAGISYRLCACETCTDLAAAS